MYRTGNAIASLTLVSALTLFVAAPNVEAGAVGGAQWSVETAPVGVNIYHDIVFRANELATVVVRGDGDTDLDVYVYDEQGNLICSDEDYTDLCIVKFAPYFTTTFRIVVVNRGRVANRYRLDTN